MKDSLMSGTVILDLKKKAFTLIELLVVIAVINILAAILFPVFARARENARRASCMSNMKQIGLGMMMYVQDYDETYPPAYRYNSDYSGVPQTDSSMPGYLFETSCGASICTGNNISWMDLIHPYVKSTQLFICPSSSESTSIPSYGYSGAFSGWTTSGYKSTATGPLKMAAVVRPSEVFLVMEYQSIYSITADPSTEGAYARDESLHNVSPHLGGGVVAFADGHVKWLTRSRLGEPGAYVSCDVNNPVSATDSAYCSRDWNPFLP